MKLLVLLYQWWWCCQWWLCRHWWCCVVSGCVVIGGVVLSVVVSSVAPEASSILLEAIPSSLDVICPHVFKNIPRMITKVIEMN